MPRAEELSRVDLVHAVLASEFDPVEGSVEIVREQRSSVAVFMSKEDLALPYMRVELLDAERRVLRAVESDHRER